MNLPSRFLLTADNEDAAAAAMLSPSAPRTAP
jgi:hypothetical protein